MPQHAGDAPAAGAHELPPAPLSEAEARALAEAMSVPVYSSAQDDEKPSEDPRVEGIRADLRRHALSEDQEKEAVQAFGREGRAPHFLLVCNKLLTGFDEPLESVMYLDAPLKDHNLLQAIARTNRVSGEKKRFGLIVDYIGVTRTLEEALAAYRTDDVRNAMRDLEEERDALRAAHRELFRFVGDVPRHTGNRDREYHELIAALDSEDLWYTFRRKADQFIRAYESLSPDPAVLDFQRDLKWVVGFIQFATPVIEKNPPPDLTGVSRKIRRLLEEHLEVTGLRTIVKLRRITDPDFWEDFQGEKSGDELHQATIRKATELKRVTYEKREQNPVRYGRFSERVLEVIRKLEAQQLTSAEALKEFEEIAKGLREEGRAHEASGMDERAYGVMRILQGFQGEGDSGETGAAGADGHGAAPGAAPGAASGAASGAGSGAATVRERDDASDGGGYQPADPLAELALEIDRLYTSPETAPAGWHRKDGLRKELRQQVRYQAHQAGLGQVQEVAARVEDYALRHYARAV